MKQYAVTVQTATALTHHIVVAPSKRSALELAKNTVLETSDYRVVWSSAVQITFPKKVDNSFNSAILKQ
jgi:hypothetical protein